MLPITPPVAVIAPVNAEVPVTVRLLLRVVIPVTPRVPPTVASTVTSRFALAVTVPVTPSVPPIVALEVTPSVLPKVTAASAFSVLAVETAPVVPFTVKLVPSTAMPPSAFRRSVRDVMPVTPSVPPIVAFALTVEVTIVISLEAKLPLASLRTRLFAALVAADRMLIVGSPATPSP